MTETVTQPVHSGKTYKREAAGAVAGFNAAVILYGIFAQSAEAIDVGKFMIPFSMLGLTSAFGAEFVRRQAS